MKTRFNPLLLVFAVTATCSQLYAAQALVTGTNLNNPTRAELLSGIVVTDFAGFTGLTLTVQAVGSHDPADNSPAVFDSGNNFALSIADKTSSVGYDFTFEGGTQWLVNQVSVISTNNLFGRNVNAGSTYRLRERFQLELTGGTIDSIGPNPRPSSDRGTLQIGGVGTSLGSIAMSLPSQNINFDASNGFNFLASGTDITAASVTYDLPTVVNPGQFPPASAQNQPFALQINVVSIPEPSASLLGLLASMLLLFSRRRAH